MIEFLKRLFTNKKSIKENIVEVIQEKKIENKKQELLDKINLLTIFLDSDGNRNNSEECSLMAQCIGNDICPDCGVWEMYDGPSGGMSQNIACGNCGGEFNHSGFTCERIRVVDLSGYKNSVVITPKIVRTWNKFDFFHDAEKRRAKTDEVIKWCDENCQGNWSGNRFYIYIEDDGDAMPFKLMFE